MQLTHFEHACVLVEAPGEGGRTVRLLLDPGNISTGFETLTGLDAVLITHQHPDHLDLEVLPALLEGNPDARVLADPDSAVRLAEAGIAHEELRPGDTADVHGLAVEAAGGEHAVIHPDLPGVANDAFLIGPDGANLFHPGDSFAPPPDGRSVDVLLVPAGGPWMKPSEAVDFLRAVHPRAAVPIHQAGLREIHRQLHHTLLQNLGPAGTEFTVLTPGRPQEV